MAEKNYVQLFKDKLKETVENIDVEALKDTAQNTAITMSGAIKDTAISLNETINLKTAEYNKRHYHPIFKEELEAFVYPKLIRVVDEDRQKNKLGCAGSVGHLDEIKTEQLFVLYDEQLEDTGLDFYASSEFGFYFLNPYENHTYISITDYFQYLQTARLSELTEIAQSLGAKRFKATIKMKKKSLLSQKATANGKAKILKSKSAVKMLHHLDEEDTLVISTSATFEGSDVPQLPVLKYFKDEPEIKKLIDMRLRPDNQLIHQTYVLDCSKKSNERLKAAASVDTVLKALKLEGNTTFESEFQEDCRKYIEYEIEF